MVKYNKPRSNDLAKQDLGGHPLGGEITHTAAVQAIEHPVQVCLQHNQVRKALNIVQTSIHSHPFIDFEVEAPVLKLVRLPPVAVLFVQLIGGQSNALNDAQKQC